MQEQHHLLALGVGRPARRRDHQVDATIPHGSGLNQTELAEGVGRTVLALEALADFQGNFGVRQALVKTVFFAGNCTDKDRVGVRNQFHDVLFLYVLCMRDIHAHGNDGH